MEVKKDIGETKKSELNLINRKRLMITGILEVISFNDRIIILDTNLGTMTIKGEGLKMNKLDVQNGDAVIVGLVNSCVYSTSESKQDKESIIAKLFR